jgi:hypothetical protein
LLYVLFVIQHGRRDIISTPAAAHELDPIAGPMPVRT